jgi:hypothetical protein
MVDIYFLKTVSRTTSGGCFVKRQRISREQSVDLSKKIDWKDQTVEEAADFCKCGGAGR